MGGFPYPEVATTWLCLRSLRKEERLLEKRADQALSPALVEAQQRLLLLRQERRRQRVAQGLPLFTNEDGRASCPLPPDPNSPISAAQELAPAFALGTHLGWESERVTQSIRRALARRATLAEQQRVLHSPSRPAPPVPAAAERAQPLSSNHRTVVALPAKPPGRNEVKLYPDIALAMLRKEQSACGRVWLLLQHLDQKRCGWLPVEIIRPQLTNAASPWRLCSWRQLRNLWRQGEGIFWQRDNGRIWLRSTAKVAAALGVACLRQRPVALPLPTLLQGVGFFRAHLYASFHSARCQQRRSSTAKPIARATLQQISRVSPCSQRVYEARAGVRRQANFVVATALSCSDEKERAWQHGRALFSFTDHKGDQGRPGKRYLAWQLPNHYVGPHAPSPQGRQKRINQYLADLFMQGMTGNGKVTEENGRKGRQRFYGTGLMAAKAYNRTPQADLYWQNGGRAHASCTLWFLLPAQPKGQPATTGHSP